MNLPRRHTIPAEMEEAILVVETGLMPDELDKLPETLISKMLIYKAIKNVSQNGGELQL